MAQAVKLAIIDEAFEASFGVRGTSTAAQRCSSPSEATSQSPCTFGRSFSP